MRLPADHAEATSSLGLRLAASGSQHGSLDVQARLDEHADLAADGKITALSFARVKAAPRGRSRRRLGRLSRAPDSLPPGWPLTPVG
jgi:hypothetical protein